MSIFIIGCGLKKVGSSGEKVSYQLSTQKGLIMKKHLIYLLAATVLASGFLGTQTGFASEPDVRLSGSSKAKMAAAAPANVYWGLDYAHVTVYRMDFKDRAQTVKLSDMKPIHDRVSEFYRICSNNKFTLKFDVHPEVIKLGRTYNEYMDDANGFRWWVADYEGAIQKLGVDPDAPGKGEVIIVCAPKFKYSSAGGYPLAKIYDVDYDYDCIRHELGHCFGLRHAQGLEAGVNVIGVEDYEAEHHNYGDVFDVMGEGDSEEHFNIAYKNYFNWFDDHEIKRVISNGTYRLYTHDQNKRSGEIIGLTLASGNGKYTYWIEFRTKNESKPGINSKNGVQMHVTGYFDNTVGKPWYRSDYAETISYLLDMTPNSRKNDTWHANDFLDAELLVGKSFKEPDGAFTVTPVAVSDSVNNEMAWIDVKITLKNSVNIAMSNPEKITVFNSAKQRNIVLRPDNQLQISLSNTAIKMLTLELLDMRGRLVKSYNRFNINETGVLVQLPLDLKGAYIVRIQADGARYSQKMVLY
jgi:hypothetical protein